MKKKYYVENEKGEMVLVRTSDHDYKFALVDIEHINEGKKGIYACSGNYNNIEKQYNYYKKIYYSNMEYAKKNNNEENYKNNERSYNNLKIVELIVR